ncbi:MAG: hypothetical protein ABR499_02695 [Gemmatimonadaceae bacterium]
MLGAALVIIASAACGRGEREGTTAGGDAAQGEVAALDYEVTPERYQRWVAAQRALDAIPGLPAPPRIDPMRLDDAAVRRAVEYLEGDARARAALASAGISARDYVLTTVALDQALVAAGASDPVASARTPGAASPSPGAGASAPVTASRPTASTTGTVTTRRAPAARPRVTGTPQRNVDLVRRNRDDVVRVLRTMRFRISESAADDLAVGDTSVTRSDSVTVGKDVTVKWDVTVRRNRDTAAARRRARAGADTARPDSTNQKSSSPRP